MLLKPYFILIYAIKAHYAMSKDATTPLSTSGYYTFISLWQLVPI